MSNLVMQELNNDPLLQHVMRDVDGQRRPVVGGIPLLSKVGEGVTGAVYRAVHPSLGRNVVVKVMLFPDEQSLRFQKFLTHAKSAIKVKSPRLIEVFEAASEAGLVYVVSEFIEGISAEKHLQALKERLKPGLPESALLNLALAGAAGLAAAHSEGVVHLDIRPSCLLIPKSANGELAFSEAKLGDMGQAYNEFSGRFLIGTAAETGMPGYMSPEQAMGVENPGKPSDVFSFGAALYALLVGQSPFGGLTIDNVLAATLHQSIGDVRTWRPDISRATSKIVEICLRKYPADRFADARVLLQALQISLDSMDCGIHIQQAAVEEIEALVKHDSVASPLTESVMASTAPVDLREPAAASHVTLPVVPQTILAIPPAAAPAPVISDVPPAPAASFAAAPKAVAPFASKGTAKIDLPPPPPEFKSALQAPVVQAAEVKQEIPASEQWDELEPEVSEKAPSRGIGKGLLVAAILLIACGAGAWKMGYIDLAKLGLVAAKKSPPPAPKLDAVAPKTSDDAEAKAKAAAIAAAAKSAKDADDLKRAEELKVRAEQDRIAAAQAEAAALAKQKEAEAKLVADAKAKAEQDRIAAEQAEAARIAKQKETEAKLAEEAAKAKAEQDRLAAAQIEAAKTAKQKETEAKLADDAAKAKVEQDRLAAAQIEAARAAKQKETEAKLAEETAKAKAEQDRLTAAAKAKAAELEQIAAEAKAKAAAAEPMPKEIDLTLGENVSMKFVLVPKGAFNMGTDPAALREMAFKAGAEEKDYQDETPSHRVEVNSFYIAKSPVTVQQFRYFVESTGYKTSADKAGAGYVLRDRAWHITPGANWANPGFSQRDDHPAVMLSHRDCEAFAQWAARQSGQMLRLPAEPEWEYAARGSSSTLFPWGDVWDGTLANHGDRRLQPYAPSGWNTSSADDGYAFTSPVGKMAGVSWCGAADMSGNVWQWCSGTYEPYPKNSAAPRILEDSSDVSPESKRALRGGSWLLRGLECRSAARRSSSPRSASCEFGMRLAFTPATVK